MKAGLLIVVVLMMMGCDGGEVGEPGGDVTESTPNDSVFDPMVQTMDQAHGVEDLSADRKRELDRQIDGSE
jgi:hypothetical protein